MAAQAAPFSRSLHPHIRFVAESGGAMVRRTHEQTDPARRVPQRQRAGVGHSRIHQSPQRRSETICLDSNRRPDSGQHGSLRPPDPYFTSLQNYFTNQCDRRLGMIGMQGLVLALIGVWAGVGGSIGGEGLLYVVRPVDAFARAAVSSLLIAAVLVASLVPALRASRVDPTVALRYE